MGIIIYGKVTDFNGAPIIGVDVRVKNRNFYDLYSTLSDEDGYYELSVEERLYYCMYACKDYEINYLEYWAWNVPAFNNLEINPQINGLEVYAINAFRHQGAYPSLLIYFRPMSLYKLKKKEESMCPIIIKEDIDVSINDEKVKVLFLNNVDEYAGEITMGAYLIQVSLPRKFKGNQYNKIDIVIEDRDTLEKGKGTAYYKVYNWNL